MTNIKNYYEVPTMVQFYDFMYEPEEGETIENYPMIGGIAYQDKVICGCCGGLYSLEELREVDWMDICFQELEWIDIVDAIVC